MARSDGLRLAVTTLTVLPVRGPPAVDRRVGGSAMLLAPVVGLLLAVPVGGLGVGVGARVGPGALLPAALAVGLLALLTRGLHLDGLADTVDGLASYRRGAEALAIMRRGDTGPLGVAAVVLVLLVDVAALQACARPGLAVGVALVTGRLALPVGCRAGTPLAAGSRLGAVVVGAVPRGRAGLLAVAVVVGAAGVGAAGGAGARAGSAGVAAGAVVAGLAAAELIGRRARRRLGGIGGDVLGAAVEVAQMMALVVLAVGGGAR